MKIDPFHNIRPYRALHGRGNLNLTISTEIQAM
jgi:hypothetical protein